MAGLNRLFQKRIQNELKMLQKDPLECIDIYPDPDDVRVWYFLIRGPDDSDYNGGWYIGKLILTENYPVTPVDFYMLTPNGRFDIEKKICLTISSYHSDQWSPIWSIQKILGAFLSVMTSDFDSGISHIKKLPAERKALANSSFGYNINMHPNILQHFKRFVVYNSENSVFIMKTLEEIKAEMPKPKEKKKKDEPIDLSSIKLTD
jgi:ubiquitin-conjugating enzyme E2 J2